VKEISGLSTGPELSNTMNKNLFIRLGSIVSSKYVVFVVAITPILAALAALATDTTFGAKKKGYLKSQEVSQV
jgi:hypothetical protein